MPRDLPTVMDLTTVRIGIDPGLSGALAVLAPDGTVQALADVPTLTLWT